MHDTAQLETAGIPSVAILSSAFKNQAHVQASSLGCADAFRVFVQHPISDQTPAQMEAKARECFDDVQRAIAGTYINSQATSTSACDVQACDTETDS